MCRIASTPVRLVPGRLRPGRIDASQGAGDHRPAHRHGAPAPAVRYREDDLRLLVAAHRAPSAGTIVASLMISPNRGQSDRAGAGRRGAGQAAALAVVAVHPMAGAMCSAMVARIRALYSTPSWFGTVNSTVSAACTASSAASSAAIWSGSPA